MDDSSALSSDSDTNLFPTTSAPGRDSNDHLFATTIASSATRRSAAYGGIPVHICTELLSGRNDDGWSTRCGEARDWAQSASKSWGAIEGNKTTDPHANVRSDFDYIGLTWSGESDRDTSLDNLDTEDWAPLQCK